MKQLFNMIRGLIVLGKIDKAGGAPQIKWLGGRATPGVPHMQGPGIFVVAPSGAIGFILAPNADPAAARAIGYDGPRPDEPAAGEGGLHYLGAWRVFMAADGTVHLGAKDPGDWAARSIVVDARLDGIESAINALQLPVSGGTAGPPSPVPFPDPGPTTASSTVRL